MKHWSFALALLTLGATAVAFEPSLRDARADASETSAARYRQAVDAFRHQRYAAAYGNFARLADAGHAGSATIALTMYRHGEMLFDRQWDATPEQQEHWQRQAHAAARVE